MICINIMVKALGDHPNETEIEQLGNGLCICLLGFAHCEFFFPSNHCF